MSASIPRNLMAALSYALQKNLKKNLVSIYPKPNQWCQCVLLSLKWAYRAAASAVSNPPITETSKKNKWIHLTHIKLKVENTILVDKWQPNQEFLFEETYPDKLVSHNPWIKKQ